MKIIKNQRVCSGCKYSSLHYCQKFKETCLSMRLNGERYQIVCPSCFNNDNYTFGSQEKRKEKTVVANFRIPGLMNLSAVETLIIMKQFYPEVFYENRRIISIYDSFPGAIWNGRQSNVNGKLYSKEELIEIKNQIENLGISLNLTWNNHLISSSNLYDNYCNLITQIFHTGQHSITVASKELFSYLKNNYPNYSYYQSIIQLDNSELPDFSLGYDKYVIARQLNNKWESLLQIPIKDRNKIEFLCNDACTPICNRFYHYEKDNQFILNHSNPGDYIYNYCTIDHDFAYFNAERWPITITSSDIDKYLENGFTNFKLCSRSDPMPILLLKILPYFVKPDYITDVFIWCLNSIQTTEVEFNKMKEMNRNEY